MLFGSSHNACITARKAATTILFSAILGGRTSMCSQMSSSMASAIGTTTRDLQIDDLGNAVSCCNGLLQDLTSWEGYTVV